MAEDPDHSSFMQTIRGVPFPKSERFIRRNIEDAMDLEPQEDDIIIASYPKTGTTWLQYIVLQIISKGEHFPSVYEAAPFLELNGVESLKSAPKPRIYKHHIPYTLVKKNDKAKCIYIYRYPEDTVVSYFHFIQNMVDKPIDFDVFFERFITGNIEFGSYFQHVLSFYAHRNDSNLYLVSYERLHANRKEEILNIAKFIGEEYHQCLIDNEDILKKVIENTQFDTMKSKLQPSESLQEDSNKLESKQKRIFFRKGIVGDGKNMLSEAQKLRIREAVENEMKGTSIADEWLQG